MADFNSTKTGAEIDNSVDQAAAALPKAGGTLTGDVTTSTAKSLNTTAQLSEDALPKSGGALTGSVTTQNAKDLDTVIDNADAGNIGKNELDIILTDLDLEIKCGFFRASDTAPNNPIGLFGGLLVIGSTSTVTTQIFIAQTGAGDRLFIRKKLTTWSAWQEVYHTGNTLGVDFNSGVLSIVDKLELAPLYTGTNISSVRSDVGTQFHCTYKNDNGQVGGITTIGTSTAFLTTSDPELKEFRDQHSDTDINAQFAKLFSCFHTFNWKNDLDGDLVWGFNAWECIDAGLDMGVERTGGKETRELALGEVYDTTPAVFEDQEQQVLYKTGENKGQPRFNSDGTPMMKTVSVEVTPEIQHKVTPAGVDQSKAVPILLAKIEQLERRLAAGGL